MEGQIFAPAIRLDRPVASRVVEGLHSPEVRHARSPPFRGGLDGRRAAKRRKDGKKRAETLKTVNADW
jgi:hypothetical protein